VGHADRSRLDNTFGLDAQSRGVRLPSARRGSDSHTHANSYSHLDSNANSYSYTDADFHAQTDADAEIGANTKASSQSAAASITVPKISDGVARRAEAIGARIT